MAGRTLDLDAILQPDTLAHQIAREYDEWNTLRNGWLEEKRELQNYIFATDTRTTSNSTLPWKNSTTLPKLTQIRDNLHANYMAALFPNSDWLVFETDREEDQEKAKVVAEYMKHKLRDSDFEVTVSRLIYDYIDTGNVFASSKFVTDTYEDEEGNRTTAYAGPRAVRISPYDIVFNPVASTFEKTPKIIRQIYSVGELQRLSEENPDYAFFKDYMPQMLEYRRAVATTSKNDRLKGTVMVADGFSDIHHYYGSQYVEVLEFHGDIYDAYENKLHTNRIITVVDRNRVVRNIVNPSWTGKSRIKHGGWRLRPDNLYAMGPLDNLVGMQYRIDHLENLRADAFDMIAYPMVKVVGVVDDFEFRPNEKIYVGEEGDVTFLSPDATVLQADTQIALLEQRMEEMAGAPKQAMGIRTPGEKTKYEVQTLENAAGRIFQSKIAHFERTVLEPLINDMLELSRRNMDGSETIKVIDDEFSLAVFRTVTKEDLTVKGTLRAKGARHFARKANMLQNLTNLANSALGQDPGINSHFSGYKIAQLIEDLLEVEKYDLVEKDIRIAEEVERQRMISAGQQQLQEEGAMPPMPPEGMPQ